MSNNNNNRNQQSTTAASTAPAESQKEPEKDLLKEAVVLCLSILLRAAVYGSVPRSHESELKEALSSLK